MPKDEIAAKEAQKLVIEHLAVLDLLGTPSLPLLHSLRQFIDGTIDFPQLRAHALSFLSLAGV